MPLSQTEGRHGVTLFCETLEQTVGHDEGQALRVDAENIEEGGRPAEAVEIRLAVG